MKKIIYFLTFAYLFILEITIGYAAQNDPFGGYNKRGSVEAGNFFNTRFGNNLLTGIGAVFAISGTLYLIKIWADFMKTVASTNEQEERADEMANKKKMLSNAIMKSIIIASIAYFPLVLIKFLIGIVNK